MPLAETLPIGPGTAQWPLRSTTARLVVTDPGSLPRARDVVADLTAVVEAACSRFRPDSELSRLPADGRPTRVSPLLAELVAAALLAADLGATAKAWTADRCARGHRGLQGRRAGGARR
jgi:FAD:protein FMN transferase